MRTIQATYRITTPMFCSGADQQKAEFRLASFKGALRFWWRTLMCGKVKDHEELRKKEDHIFGASEQKVGQSKVRLTLTSPLPTEQLQKSKVWESGKLTGAHYLGYGVMEAFDSRKNNKKAGELTRPMLLPGQSADIEIRFSPFLSEDDIDSVTNALILLGTIGGMGSKSRKGFGSLTLTRLEGDGSPSLVENLENRLKTLIGKPAPNLPEWTAWSEIARFIAVQTKSRRAEELLNDIGRELVLFRSWGKAGKVFSGDSEQNFKDDHDLNEGIPSGIDYPRRVAFGLPHNYGKGPQNTVEPANKDHNRRASPLFIHIHQPDENAKPIGILAFLPSRFLPEGERINAFGNPVPLEEGEQFWCPIHAFLDRLKYNGSPPEHRRPGYETFPENSQWWKSDRAFDAQEVNLV